MCRVSRAANALVSSTGRNDPAVEHQQDGAVRNFPRATLIERWGRTDLVAAYAWLMDQSAAGAQIERGTISQLGAAKGFSEPEAAPGEQKWGRSQRSSSA